MQANLQWFQWPRRQGDKVRCASPMEHMCGFMQSHYMSPLGDCQRHIAPAAAMIDKFVETTQNTNIHNF
jgi:hypothetical protein